MLYEINRVLVLVAVLVCMGGLSFELDGEKWSVGHQSNATGAQGAAHDQLKRTKRALKYLSTFNVINST